MLRLAKLFFCACVGLTIAQPATSAPEKPFLDIELDAAFARAEAQDKVLFMFYHSSVINQSRQMVETTFKDPEIREWISENFIAIQLDIETHRPAFSRFKVRDTPTIQLRSGDKRLLEVITFYKTAAELKSTVKAALTRRTVKSKPEGEFATDPHSWLAWGNYLFNNEGDPTQMVQAYSWCLQQADRYEPGFRAQHFEFLLKRIAYAKQATPEALRQLTQERNRLTGILHGGNGTDLLAAQLVRVNFWMRSEELTREAFLDLANKDAATESLRRVLMYHELSALVAHRQYKEILEHLPNPNRELESRLKRNRDAETRAAAEETEVDLGVVVSGLPESRSQWTTDASLFYECLLAVGRGKDAADLMELVLNEVPTGRAYALFIDKQVRLDLPELAIKTATRGLEKVKGQGARRIETAIVRIKNKFPDEAEAKDGDR